MIKFASMKKAVVYATDENYVKLTAVSICSLLHANPNMNIVVLADAVTKESCSFLSRLVARCGGTLEIIDAAPYIAKIVATGAGGYVSFSTYSRLFIPAILENKVERAIYIDGDTLITDSLHSLFDMELDGKPFAIGYDCLCNRYKKLIDIQQDAPYFNAGVLLIDIGEWRRRKCTDRIFDYMNNIRHDFMFGDQDYFSLVLADDAAILPPEYNFLTHFQMFKTRNAALTATGIPDCAWYSEAQYAAAQAHPVIHHFLGHTLGRPWFKESRNPLRPLFKHFASEAGVPEVAEQSRPMELSYRLQHLCWRCLPQPLFALACRAMYSYYFRTRYGV